MSVFDAAAQPVVQRDGLLPPVTLQRQAPLGI